MKAGDYLFCKSNLIQHFIKGQKYKIIDVTTDTILVEQTTATLYDIPCRHFTFAKEINNKYLYAWDYFITIQELRKLKIKQLNQIQ